MDQLKVETVAKDWCYTTMCISGLTVKEIITTVQNYSTPEMFAYKVLRLTYETAYEKARVKTNTLRLNIVTRDAFPDWFRDRGAML